MPHITSCLVFPGTCELRCGREDYHVELSQSQIELNSLRALASPTYLVLTSPDPILTAFYLARDLSEKAAEKPEFRDELMELSDQCAKFAAGLLDQCQTSEEVSTRVMMIFGETIRESR